MQKIFLYDATEHSHEVPSHLEKTEKITENMAFKVGKGKDFEIIAINASSRNVNI